MTRSTTSWLADVDDAERRGELLLAFDLACCGLEEHPSDAGLRYRAVLALARAGSTDEAARQFDRFDLASIESEDVEALAARIKKDRALAAKVGDQPRLAREAAEAYRRVGYRTGGYFPPSTRPRCPW